MHRGTFLQGKLLMRNSMIRNRLILFVAAVAVCLAGSQSALATLYNVDCGTSAPSPLMSGAAVLGSDGDVWNAYTNGSWVGPPGAIITLQDSTGSSAAGVTFNAWNNSGSSNWPAGNEPVNPAALMEDYLEAPGWGAGDGWPIKAQISGLPASAAFDLVVYSSGNGTGQGATITLYDPSGNLVEATSAASRDIDAGEGVAYVAFQGTTDANGGVYFEVKTTTDNWHALNGLQINVVPEPSTFVLLSMAAAMLLVVRKRR
jgi:hypothetical protein